MLTCLTSSLPALGCASTVTESRSPAVDPSRPTIALVREDRGAPVLARWREQASSTVTFQRASDGARVEKSSETRKLEEVLATDGDAATKVRVTYDEDKAVANGADAEQSSRAARTYVVERTNGGGVVVTGGPESGRDVERVKDDYRTLGDAEQILRNVLAQRLDVGDHVDAWTIAAAVRDYLSLAEGGRDYEVAEAAANFAGERDGAAIFAVRLKLTRKLVDQARTRHLVEADLRGTLTVRASDARPLTLALEGPFTEFEGPARRLEDGSVNLSDRVSRGTATFRMSRTYP